MLIISSYSPNDIPMRKEITFNHSDLIDLMVACVHLIYFTQNNRNTITLNDLVKRYPMIEQREDITERIKTILKDFIDQGAIYTNDNFNNIKLYGEKLLPLTIVIADKMNAQYNSK